MTLIPFSPRDDGAGAFLRAPIAYLADEAFDRYVDWREQAAVVTRSYEQWAEAPRADESQSYGAYLTALEHEQRAAQDYAVAVIAMERCLAAAARRHRGARRGSRAPASAPSDRDR